MTQNPGRPLSVAAEIQCNGHAAVHNHRVQRSTRLVVQMSGMGKQIVCESFGKPPWRIRLKVLGHQLRSHPVQFFVGGDGWPVLYRCRACRKSWEAPWLD